LNKKVLHLLSSNKYSGAENVVCQIIGMFKSEIDMIYCSPSGPIAETLMEKSIDFIPLKKVSIKEVKTAIRKYNPDVIHAHDIRASIIAAYCSNTIPVVSHIHGKFKEMSRISVKSLLYRTFTKKFSHIFAVSNSILDEYYFRNTIRSKSSVLRNVINYEDLVSKIKSDKNEPAFDCIFLGRFSYLKNPQRLITIISKVIDQLPNSKFVLVGEGELLEETKDLAMKLNVEKNIVFTGFLKNPYPILNSSKVMLMSSRTEGTPMCVLESMLLGVPVVSTAVDGIKEVIEHGEDGFYYDDDEEIVQAICKLIIDNELREMMSNNAFKKARAFNNLDKYKLNILNIYEKHLKNN
jgi:glycosyltransferase involved in cell wall biosynthesis